MRRWIGAFALVAAMVVVAGCGSSSNKSSSTSSSSNTSSSSSGSSGSGKKVVYISPVAAEPGQQQINEGLTKGAAELGWSENVLDSALSANKQVSNIELATTQKVAAIASWTLNPQAAAGAYTKAQAEGIPVIGMNSEGTGITSTVWWEDEQCKAGGPWEKTAQLIAKIHPHAKTIMLGLEVATSTKFEGTCFKKEAEKAGLKIINYTNNEADTSSGSQQVFSPLLTKYPEVEAVWCYNDETALGASAAIIASGKKVVSAKGGTGIVVTGSNGDTDAIQAVEQGRLTLTWDPDNVASGFAAIDAMNEAIKAGKGSKPPDITVKAQEVDSETISSYVPPKSRHYTLQSFPRGA